MAWHGMARHGMHVCFCRCICFSLSFARAMVRVVALSHSLSLSRPGVRVATASRPLPSCAHAHPRSLAGLLPPLSVFSTERLGCTRGKLPPTGVQAVFPRGASFSPQGSKQVLVSFTVPTKHTLHTASLTEGPAEEVLVTTAAVTPTPCSVE